MKNTSKKILIGIALTALISFTGCTNTKPISEKPQDSTTKKADTIKIPVLNQIATQEEALSVCIECKKNLVSIGSACESYSAQHDNKYPKTLNELSPTYLEKIPICPADKAEYSYTSGYKKNEAGDGGYDWYQVECKNASTAHADPSNPSKIISGDDALGFNSIMGIYTSKEQDIQNI